jgi:hypothetical protein
MTRPAAVVCAAGGSKQTSPPRNAALGATLWLLLPEPFPSYVSPLAPGHNESVSVVVPEMAGSPEPPATTLPPVPPSGGGGVEHVPDVGSHVDPVAVHVTGFEPMHAPELQASVWVHAFPSVHGVPFGAGGFEHPPDVGSHVPATWHGLEATHATGFDPVHAPPWHVSLWVHALPSLHTVPFVAVGFEHEPLAGSHVPATWHASLAAHVTGFDPVQVPLAHAYVCSHLLVPVHAVPSEAAGFEHAPVAGLQVPAV